MYTWRHVAIAVPTLIVGLCGMAILVKSQVTINTVGQSNVYNAEMMGVDCSGATDSATALQAAITAIPNSSMLHFPIGCTVKLGSTISITDRVGLTLASDVSVQNYSGSPQFRWAGGASGTMFDIEHSDHVTFRGFHFDVQSGSVIAFLNFDGNPGAHIGTLPEVSYSDFNATNQSLASFNVIALSLTATGNWENSYFHDNTITCSNGSMSNRATDVITTNGSATITSATATFVAGDVGKRAQISYPGYFLDTTIQSRSSGTTVALAANNIASLTGAQITIGTFSGVGINQGASQNAKHSRFHANKITNCDVGIKVQGGSADIFHLGGGFGGTGILFSSPSQNTESMTINFYENEGDFRGIETHGGVAPFIIMNSRIANANQFADGFYKLAGQVILMNSGQESNTCGTNPNSVLIGEKNSVPVILTSINNNFNCSSLSTVGYAPSFTNYTSLLYGFPISINDNIGINPNSTLRIPGSVLFMPGLPTSSAGLASGRVWSNSGVLTVVP